MITFIIRCGIKSLIPSQTLTVHRWSLGWIKNFIPHFTVRLRVHTGIKVNSHIECLVQDFSIPIANALEILQSCTKLSICKRVLKCLTSAKGGIMGWTSAMGMGRSWTPEPMEVLVRIHDDRAEHTTARILWVVEATGGEHGIGVVRWGWNSEIVQVHSWWRHQMETFPRYWTFVWGIHRSPVNSPHKAQ